MPDIWKDAFATNPIEPAATVYCIAFTPRSGSTWLGDILHKTGALGDPKEWFNPQSARHAIKQSGCHDIHEYYRYLRTVKQQRGVFGFEIAYQHLALLRKEGYSSLFADINHWFFLRRRDYIAQAVSLHRASRTGIFHSNQQQEKSYPQVDYDNQQIANFALKVVFSEFRFKKYFSDNMLATTDIWYEDFLSMPATEIPNVFRRQLGQAVDHSGEQAGHDSDFQKTSDESSSSMISRFREQNPAFVNYWDKHRGLRGVTRFLARHPSYASVKEGIKQVKHLT